MTIMRLPAETDIEAVKAVAKTLLYTDVHTTAYSPIAVLHPFTSTGIVMVKKNGEACCVDITKSEEDLSLWRTAVAKQIENEKDAYHVYMLLNKTYAMTFLKFAKHAMSKRDFSKTLATAWICSENPNNDPNLSLSELLSLFRLADHNHLMSAEECQKYFSLDDEITVYRGVTSHNSKNVRALSWTLNKNVAEWFATRFGESGVVYQAIIDKPNVLAYFDGRNESEVIVNPKYLKNVRKTM